jgi:ABC-type arginine transport system permease subunit
MVMKFYAKIFKFYINGEESSAGFSTTVIRGIPEICKCIVCFKSNTLQMTQKLHDTFTVTQFSVFFGYRPDLITFFEAHSLLSF